CSKTVVDFTKMTDRQIVQLLENSSGKMCGRLLNDQMDRVITDNTENGFYKFPRLVAGLLLAGTATNSIAQSNEVKTEIVSSQNSEEYVLGKIATPKEIKIDSAKNFIQGTVLDNNKEIVIGATVVVVDEKLNNTNIATMTDLDGNFKLYVSDELFNNDSNPITIRISYVGLKSAFVTIYKIELPVIKREFSLQAPAVSMGDVILVGGSKPQIQTKSLKKKHK
ncbi:MAG TPA: carboxypeptidase-like regulatory domain-containing protein, partial [Chitinophagales bacterium]